MFMYVCEDACVCVFCNVVCACLLYLHVHVFYYMVSFKNVCCRHVHSHISLHASVPDRTHTQTSESICLYEFAAGHSVTW